MRQYLTVLTSKLQTGREMYRLVRVFAKDLKTIGVLVGKEVRPLADLTLEEYFDFVKNLPYRMDVKPVEIVGRPKYIVAMARAGGIDCKKKSVLIASWLYLHGIRFRFMTVSNKPSGKIHHIFPQMEVNGKWLNLDATYSRYRPFQGKRVTAWEVV